MIIPLPSDPEAWVSLDPSKVLVRDAQNVFTTVLAAIIDWNLTDDDGLPVEVSKEAVKRLPVGDVHYLHEKIEFNYDRKKLRDVVIAVSSSESQFPVPLEYTLYRYRKEMGLTYDEVLGTPLVILNQDIEFISIENQLKNNQNQYDQ